MDNHIDWWVGVEFFFRNNSTGNPTLRHIINPITKKSFCGFDDFIAQIYIGSESDYLDPKNNCCKKCLNGFFKNN